MSDPDRCRGPAQAILDRHLQAGVKEAEIGAAVRDFLIATGLVPASEIEMEQAPAAGSAGRVDLRTRDVIIEFKVRIGDRINPRDDYVEQLDDYLAAAVTGGQPQRFGILTDGKYWILRWPGMGPVRTQAPHAFTLSDAEHGLLLYEWLRNQSQALEERGIAPSDEEIRNRLGDGPRFEQHILALSELYEANRDDPTIALKRDLWRSLLAAALGQVVEQEPDLDRLFVRHTYLSVVVGLAVQAAFGIEIEAAAHDNPTGLLGGQLFVDQTGVSGVVESDFFTWPSEVGGDEWIRDLAKRIGWFDWNEAESDIARILYESVIPADDRRRLGEYYTPDWLAREIVDAVVTDPLNQRVLDPACGSGSFIFAAVRKYLAAAQAEGRTPAQAVGGLLDHVIGIDVHPVAVHLARATWTLAARDALEGAVEDGEAVSATVPVYLGDSLQLRAETSGMFAQQTVAIPVPDPPDSDLEFNRELQFPRALVEQADWFDNLMTRMANAIENGEDPAWALDEEDVGQGDDRRMLERTAALLQKLHDEGRDHIWAYYTRNLVRPVALRADPVDAIVGNPPWITYNQTQAVLRERTRTPKQGALHHLGRRTLRNASGHCGDVLRAGDGVVPQARRQGGDGAAAQRPPDRPVQQMAQRTVGRPLRRSRRPTTLGPRTHRTQHLLPRPRLRRLPLPQRPAKQTAPQSGRPLARQGQRPLHDGIGAADRHIRRIRLALWGSDAQWGNDLPARTVLRQSGGIDRSGAGGQQTQRVASTEQAREVTLERLGTAPIGRTAH